MSFDGFVLKKEDISDSEWKGEDNYGVYSDDESNVSQDRYGRYGGRDYYDYGYNDTYYDDYDDYDEYNYRGYTEPPEMSLKNGGKMSNETYTMNDVVERRDLHRVPNRWKLNVEPVNDFAAVTINSHNVGNNTGKGGKIVTLNSLIDCFKQSLVSEFDESHLEDVCTLLIQATNFYENCVVVSKERNVIADCLKYFKPYEVIVRLILVIIKNVVSRGSIRNEFLTLEIIECCLEIVQKSSEEQNSRYLASAILLELISEDSKSIEATIGKSCETILDAINKAVDEWDLNGEMKYEEYSFRLQNNILLRGEPAAKYWSLWSIAFYTTHNYHKFYSMIHNEINFEEIMDSKDCFIEMKNLCSLIMQTKPSAETPMALSYPR